MRGKGNLPEPEPGFDDRVLEIRLQMSTEGVKMQVLGPEDPSFRMLMSAIGAGTLLNTAVVTLKSTVEEAAKVNPAEAAELRKLGESMIEKGFGNMLKGSPNLVRQLKSDDEDVLQRIFDGIPIGGSASATRGKRRRRK